MNAVLAVDGGQSGIRVRHSAGDRIVEVAGVSRQEGDTVAAVAAAVADAWRTGGFPPVDLIVLGLTTVPGSDHEANRLAALVAQSTGAREVLVTDDAVTGHAGALSGCPGVSIIAGTGVASLALPEDGDARIIGGHGFLLGDEGGGFWIGRAGLTAVLRAEDGRGPATSMSRSAARSFGDVAGLHIRLHDDDRPVHAIAEFARDVLAAADAGDPVASGILEEAAAELLALVRVGAQWVGGQSVAVAFGGRVLAEESSLRHRLDALIPEAGLAIVARTADGLPLDGAMLLGTTEAARRYGGLVHRWGAAAQ
jgi:N-acetylglucosamine kinase-like BadF-type ATPase